MTLHPRPSKFSRASLATLRRVWHMSTKGKGTRPIRLAMSHSSTSMSHMVTLSFSLESVIFLLGSSRLLISLRLSLCLWLESIAMRFPVWIPSLLRFILTRFAMWFRHVYHTRQLSPITIDIFRRHICISSSGTHTGKVAIMRMQYNRWNMHDPKYDSSPVDHSWWSH